MVNIALRACTFQVTAIYLSQFSQHGMSLALTCFAGIFRKAAGSAVHLDSCIENFGQVCLPGLPQYRAIASAPRPPTVPPPGVTTDAAAVAAANDTHQQPQQWVRLTNSSYPNWCAAHGYLESGALGFPFRSPLPADNPNPMCRMQVGLWFRAQGFQA